MWEHTHLSTHSKAPAHTHTCSHINKCPSTISKKGHLEPIIIVIKLQKGLSGSYRASLAFAWYHLGKHNTHATTQQGRSCCSVAGEGVNTASWVTQIRSKASYVMAAEGPVPSSQPYSRAGLCTILKCFSLKVLMEISASLAQWQVGHSLLALNL